MRAAILGLVLATGCATAATTAPPRPTIASASDDVVRVCLDGAAFAVGAPVRFSRDVCKPLNAKSAVVRCSAEPLADGEVVRVEGGCADVRVRGAARPAQGDRVTVAAR